MNAEIISCDSRGAYKGVKALTAVPFSTSGIPYHLADFLSPKKRWDASSYAKTARKLIAQILKRKPFVIVAGGSGFYYRALMHGLSPLPAPDPKLRKKLESKLSREGLPSLARELKTRDPQTYQRIDIFNPRRVIRALELTYLLKGPIGAHLDKTDPLPYPFLGFHLQWPKDILKQRIALRARKYFNRMKIEVKSLSRYGVKAPIWEALLAAPIQRHLKGETSREEALRECAKADMEYAKRQMTWFKKEAGLITIDMKKLKGDPKAAAKSIARRVR